MNQIIIINFTNFFNRELMIYSLFDFRFKKPVLLKKVAWILGLLIAWNLLLYNLFGVVINLYYAILMIAPPSVLGHFAAKPVWAGRGLFDFLRTLAGFIASPKALADRKEADALRGDGERLYVDSAIWVSRRRELAVLAELRERRAAAAAA